MGKIGIKTAGTVVTPPAPSTPVELSAEDRSKDAFFAQVAEIRFLFFIGALLQNPQGDLDAGDVLAAYMHLQDGDPTYQAQRRFCVIQFGVRAGAPSCARGPR